VENLLALPLGFVLDQLLGDPPSWPHPVRWLGRLIHFLETPLRKLFPERLGGVLLLLLVAGAAGGASWGALELAGLWHPAARLVLAAVLVYYGLAARSLARETQAVLEPCGRGDWEEARRRLGGIVGRDTHDLPPEDVYRACVETVAENTTDGVVAPLVYAALAGPVGLWAYKAVSTLDSMVGYRSPRYLRFGWASARADDLANYLPARLTFLLLALAALLTGGRARQALRLGWRDGRKHPSPNSAWAEAAMAGALGVQLGGPSTYGRVPSEKPRLGDHGEPLTPAAVRRAVRLMLVTAWLALTLALALAGAISLHFGQGAVGQGLPFEKAADSSRREKIHAPVRKTGPDVGPGMICEVESCQRVYSGSSRGIDHARDGEPMSRRPLFASKDPVQGDRMDKVTETWVTIPERPLSASSRTACLVHIYPTGPGMGSRYPLADTPLVLGRGSDCDIRIADHSVSRRHARIQPSADGYYAVDLQSTNGTFVNDAAASMHRLKDGDYLRVGNCIYRFLTGGNVEAEYHEEIYRLTIIDALTDTHNKRYLLEFLDRELARSSRYRRPLALIMFDIDLFKSINDQLGHLGGDFTLRELAACIKSSVRKEELFARYGGEEFAVVLPETTGQGAVHVAERVRRLIETHPFQYEDKSYHITISLGVACTDGEQTLTPSQLIRLADDKLYQAKREGRNRVVA
jgi:cobalamin biosynthesis protein CobD